MRTTHWFLGIAFVFILSVGFKFQFSAAAADTIDSKRTVTPPAVLGVQQAIASSSEVVASTSTSSRDAFATSSQTDARRVPRTVSAPQRLLIPSLGLNVAIQPVGVNQKGEMDVPSGASSNVGWYKDGTMPGNVGSAVLDAHVFAVFKDLRYLKIGSPIYVETKGGTKLRFRVVDSRIYTLDELTSNILFGQHDARRLNLITCAGTYVPSINTYDHRLVVFAIFEDEE